MDAVSAVSCPHGKAGARYSLRDNPQAKDPDYLYLSDSASVPSSKDLHDGQQAAFTNPGLPSRVQDETPKSKEDQEAATLVGSFPSRCSAASHANAYPVNAGCDLLGPAGSLHMCAKPKRKVGRPLKHEGFIGNPNLTEKRKLRRRTANRECARRVRDRRSQRSDSLEAKVSIHCMHERGWHAALACQDARLSKLVCLLMIKVLHVVSSGSHLPLIEAMCC